MPGTSTVTQAPTVDRESLTRDRLTHIVKDRDKVRLAILEGFPVRALCGKIWAPTRWKPADGLRCQVCDMLARRDYPATP